MAKRKVLKRPKRKAVPGLSGKEFSKLTMDQKIRENQRDINILMQLFKDLDDYRDSQRDFLTDLMFSINAISEVLTKGSRTLRFLENKGLKDSDTITYGQLKQMLAPIPVVNDVDLMSTKARIISAYMEKRKKFRPLTYDGITLEAQQWAKKLEVDYDELESFLSEDGVTLKDYIEMNGLENLVEDLSPDEEAVVKKNTAETIKNIRARASEKPKLTKPVEEMSDAELEAYLAEGGSDEPDGNPGEQPQAT